MEAMQQQRSAARQPLAAFSSRGQRCRQQLQQRRPQLQRPRRPSSHGATCSLNNTSGSVAGERGARRGGVCGQLRSGAGAPLPCAARGGRAGGRAGASQPPPDHSPAAPPAVKKPAKLAERETLRMGIPSKGRMADDTLALLKVSSALCALGRRPHG